MLIGCLLLSVILNLVQFYRSNPDLSQQNNALQERNGKLIAERDALNAQIRDLIRERDARQTERDALRVERDQLLKRHAVLEEKSPSIDTQSAAPAVDAQPAPK